MNSPQLHSKWKHHTGPISSEFIENVGERRKSRYERKKTLCQKGHQLAQRCGGEIFIQYTDINNKTWTYVSNDSLWERYQKFGITPVPCERLDDTGRVKSSIPEFCVHSSALTVTGTNDSCPSTFTHSTQVDHLTSDITLESATQFTESGENTEPLGTDDQHRITSPVIDDVIEVHLDDVKSEPASDYVLENGDQQAELSQTSTILKRISRELQGYSHSLEKLSEEAFDEEHQQSSDKSYRTGQTGRAMDKMHTSSGGKGRLTEDEEQRSDNSGPSTSQGQHEQTKRHSEEHVYCDSCHKQIIQSTRKKVKHDVT